MSGAMIVEELEPLFNPGSVAVIGATNNPNKWGYSTFSSMLNGFAGTVYPVNNREDEVLGHKAYQRVTDIPGPVDLAIFVIPASSVPLVMEDCVAKGVRAGIIITAGFAEVGEEGKKLQDEVLRIARRGGLRFVGPNCMGLWSASSNLRAFMFPMLVKDGPLAFVSQGGNIGGATVMSAYQRGVGFRRYVSCGCAADLQIEDYIEYFGDDPEVKVILAYIEGLNDGKRFIDKVKQVTRQKPVIVLKPGKTDAAAKAIRSHSGALAGSSVVYNAAFREAGAIRVESPEELLDVALGFLTQPLPRGRNVAIITPGGSYGVLCADACAYEGLNVIKLPDETISALDRMFPPRWSRGNPIDPAGDRNFIAYLTAPEKILTLDEVDSLIFMGFGSFSSLGSSFSDILPPMLPFSKELEERVSLITQLVKSGDAAQIGQVVRSTVDVLGPFIGARDGAELDDFTRTVTAAMASGEIDISLLGPAPTEKGTPGTGAKEGSRRMATLSEGIDSFLGGLIRYWVRTYGKPLISTTFTEGVSHLRGRHFAYSSGERAARVLIKLVEYSEYLQREGIKV
jgi:acetyl-CoA synthetase (ADP-forming)